MADGKTATHGDFVLVSTLASDLQERFREASRDKLEHTTRAAIEQILVRVARIVYGDQNHRKHWEDIQGFCQVKLDSAAAPQNDIEKDVERLVRTLPTSSWENVRKLNDAT